jgi:Flp pilus assembly protein TadD
MFAVLTQAACTDTETQEKLDGLVTQEAQQAEQNRDYEAASRHYATLYQHKPDDPGVIQGLARALRNVGRFEEARTLLDDAVARLGPQPRLLLERGKDEISLGHADLAVQTLTAAIKATPADWEAPATLAIAYDRLGRTDEAEAQYRVATSLNPDNADILNNYALSRALAGHLDEALSLLRRAVTLPSAGPQVRENLALLEGLAPQHATVSRGPRPLVDPGQGPGGGAGASPP